ncbi:MULTISPECIES: O-antigen ligase family protein [unclassified Streptomyces]|uniref:O-antigen ligase family protein n=1 Tax=unclassified Streptomyces TaxID=2593676 RepID=UPI003FA35981
MAVTSTLPAAVRRPPGHVRAHLVRLGPLLPGVLTVLLLCAPVHEDASRTGQATPADVASGLFVLGCAVWLLRTRTRPLDGPAACVLAAPAVACAVATAASYDPGASLPGFVRYAQIFVLVPAAVVLVLRDPHGFRVLAGAVLVLALVQGAVGVRQYLTGTGASYVGQDIRAVGTFGPQDVMGMSAVVSCGLLVALGLGLAPPAGSPRRLRPAALGGAALLLVPLAVSFSRGAWIATAVASAAVLMLAGARLALRTFGVLAAAAVLLVGGLGVGSQLIGERMSSITDVTAAPDQSVTDRYTMWAAATSIWRQDPATGVGPKGFAAHRDAHASLALSSGSDTAGAGQDFRKEPLLSPHNMYLLVLSEQGLLGLTAVAGGWAVIMARTLRRLRAARAAPPSPARATDCGLIAAGLLIWHLVDFGYSDIGGPSTVLTGITLGLAAWWALGRGAVPESGAPLSAGAEAR